MIASTLENCPDCGRPIPESALQAMMVEAVASAGYEDRASILTGTLA